MYYITQLIFIKANQEATFNEFEEAVIPLISQYNGEMLLRIRPDVKSIIQSNMDSPYELHLVAFDSKTDFDNFMKDEIRNKFLYLKEQAIESVIMFEGKRIN